MRRADEVSFRKLYRVHTPGLYRFVLRILGGGDPEAEEAVQMTWVQAVQNIAGFRWESSLRTWLAGIALNTCRQIRRRRARERIPLEPGARELTVFNPRQDGARMDLEKAIASLPEGYREVLVLHDVEGYTHEEIAALLGIDPGTSKSQLSRARRELRERLSGLIVRETPEARPS
ncbi:MAG: sigma-70 family RNA polymerase sigma factor [Acidobacteria bacterium]|nr:sigma-70 family RNA polymerase sigma factor [Acidobacteriota bacterium]